MSQKKKKTHQNNYVMTENGTQVNCFVGSNTVHYTTITVRGVVSLKYTIIYNEYSSRKTERGKRKRLSVESFR